MFDVQTLSGLLERGEIDSARFLELLVRHVAQRIGCSRAALRLLSETGRGGTLRTVALYDRAADRLTSAPDIGEPEPGGFLARLRRDGSVVITDTAADPFVGGQLADYCRDGDVRALVEMACSINGTLVGTIACEQVGTPVDWTQPQVQWMRRSASRVSLTLAHVARTGVDTTPGGLWDLSLSQRLATLPMPLDPPER